MLFARLAGRDFDYGLKQDLTKIESHWERLSAEYYGLSRTRGLFRARSWRIPGLAKESDTIAWIVPFGDSTHMNLNLESHIPTIDHYGLRHM